MNQTDRVKTDPAIAETKRTTQSQSGRSTGFGNARTLFMLRNALPTVIRRRLVS